MKKFELKYPKKIEVEEEIDSDDAEDEGESEDAKDPEISEMIELVNATTYSPKVDEPNTKLKDIQNHTGGTLKQSKNSSLILPNLQANEEVHKENCMPAPNLPVTSAEKEPTRKPSTEDSDYGSNTSITSKRCLDDYESDCEPKLKSVRLSFNKDTPESSEEKTEDSETMSVDEPVASTSSALIVNSKTVKKRDPSPPYVIEDILAYRTVNNKLQFRVKWLGYQGPYSITWEPLCNVKGIVEFENYLIKEYGNRYVEVQSIYKNIIESQRTEIDDFFSKKKKLGIAKELDLFDIRAFKCDLVMSLFLNGLHGDKRNLLVSITT